MMKILMTCMSSLKLEKPLAPGSNQGQRNNISHPYYKGESGGNQDE